MLPVGNSPAGTVQDPFVRLINGDACYEKVVEIATLLIRLSSQYVGTPPLSKLVTHLKISDHFVKWIGAFGTLGQVLVPDDNGKYVLLDNSKGYVTAGKVAIVSIFLFKVIGAAFDDKFGVFSKPQILRNKVFTNFPAFNLMTDIFLSIFCAATVWKELPACFAAFNQFKEDDFACKKWQDKHLFVKWSGGEQTIGLQEITNNTKRLKDYYTRKVETLQVEVQRAKDASTNDVVKESKLNAAQTKLAFFEQKNFTALSKAFRASKKAAEIGNAKKYNEDDQAGKIEQNIQFYATKVHADQTEFRRAGWATAACL